VPIPVEAAIASMGFDPAHKPACLWRANDMIILEEMEFLPDVWQL
jgi:hypothetical protein